MIYFGIPSYHRAEKQPTLDYLESVGVRKEQIIMSVQTKDDYNAYKVYANRVGELLFKEAKNVSGNTNTILQFVDRNEKIIIMDDDIKCVSRLTNGKLQPLDSEEKFNQFIQFGYGIAKNCKTIGFSVYPVNNPFFMSKTVNKVHFGEGTLLALTNTGLLFDESLDTKSDYDLTCRIIKAYGAYPRLNMYSCNAPHYTKGGCGDNWEDKDKVLRDANQLLLRYPNLVKANTKRKGEILMRNIGGKIVFSEDIFKEEKNDN